MKVKPGSVAGSYLALDEEGKQRGYRLVAGHKVGSPHKDIEQAREEAVQLSAGDKPAILISLEGSDFEEMWTLREASTRRAYTLRDLAKRILKKPVEHPPVPYSLRAGRENEADLYKPFWGIVDDDKRNDNDYLSGVT